MWTVNFLMFKLVLEEAEEPETKLPTSAGSWKKQESSRKTSISALLTMPKSKTIHFHWDKRIKKSKLSKTTWGFNTEISTRLLLSNADYFNENMCVSHSYISSEFSWSPTHSWSLKNKGISFILILFFANLVFNWKIFALQNLVFFWSYINKN